MKSYCVIGWSLIAAHIAAAMLLAPQGWSVAEAALLASGYLALIWLISGLYVANVLHLGIAHRALEFRSWFIKTITVLNGVAGIYVDPRAWVNRHRHHHAFSDHEGDPSKHAEDGFWKTLYLCLVPYPCKAELSNDKIFDSRTMRAVCHPAFGIVSQLSSFGLLWLAVLDAMFAFGLWLGVRLVALWVNMIQNFWSHDRRFGSRIYPQDTDNAVNITEWLPVTATFSACLQNNHHHHPRFARMSHDESQFDFGLLSVRFMQAIGLVRALPEGRQIPEGVTLTHIGL
ncbi:MAG: fatty acid desaturase [Burkholderiales bacterium]